MIKIPWYNVRSPKERDVQVIIESAGDHGFDMPHLKRSGAEELVRLLLERAGFQESSTWRVRVNEKKCCSGMTPPVSVLRHSKWGVHVRIKPGDNNTCHNVVIIMPNGLKSEDVFVKTKGVVKDFNRNWRKAEAPIAVSYSATPPEVPVAMAEEVVKVSDEVAAAVAETMFDLKKYLRSDDNIKTICRSVHNMENEEFPLALDFTKELCKDIGIKITNKQCGAMMRSMIKRGLCDKTYHGDYKKHSGYRLTEAGRKFIRTAKHAVEPEPEPVFDRSGVIMSLGTIAQDIVSASARLKDIVAEKSMILEKLHSLEREERDICDLVGETEVGSFVNAYNKLRAK